ncbi:hypothetical protein BFJ72_g5634 [Fusarium proliferatum]|uniref:Uncharacterized protein n=1 Tax=Gibberella intermedia TaxID=948311 RepID=A0A420TI65_GIBIN|nr:hypothetical protein BFJ72_g5634 [Fusarium proliferatum]
MTSLQTLQHQGCADFFSALAPKLRIEILDRTPLQDLRHLISASPALLSVFQRHRPSLLGHHVQDLLKFYVDKSLLPFAAITMDLRAIRAEYKDLTVSELEEKLKPALDSVISQEYPKQPTENYPALAVLEMAQNLVPELRRAFDTYQENVGSKRLLEDAPWEAKFTFIEDFLRLDCYCNIFYYRTEFLFSTLNHAKKRFTRPFLYHPRAPVEKYPWTFMCTMLKRYRGRITRLGDSLRSRQPKPVEGPGTWTQDVSALQVKEFLHRDGIQQHFYVIHLLMGGYPHFAKLQSLTAEEFERYTLEEFYRVVIAEPKGEEWMTQWIGNKDTS